MSNLDEIDEGLVSREVAYELDVWTDSGLSFEVYRVVDDASFELGVVDEDGNERVFTFTCREN